MASVIVSAGLCEFPLVKHANLMRMSHRRQAMCNNLGFTKGDSPTSIRSIRHTLRAPNLLLRSFMIFLKYVVLHCPAPLCVFYFARLEQAVAHEKPVWAHMAWDLSIVHTLLYYIGLYYTIICYIHLLLLIFPNHWDELLWLFFLPDPTTRPKLSALVVQRLNQEHWLPAPKESPQRHFGND